MSDPFSGVAQAANCSTRHNLTDAEQAERRFCAAPGKAQSIFRAQAVAATQDKWLGSVRIARNWRFSTYTALALLVGFLLFAFATWGEFTRKARLPGLLVPAGGTLPVSSHSLGVLAQTHVAEGQTVAAGQTLFTIDTDRNAGQGALATLLAQQIAQKQQSLQAESALRNLQNRQRADALAQRDASLAAELRQVQAEHELMAQRTQLAEKSLARQQELAKNGFVSDAQIQTKAEELIDLQTRQRSAERNRVALERERSSLQAELTALATSLQTEQEQLKRSMASLQQEQTENHARRQVVVAAAQAGQITAIHTQPGQPVQPGSNMATLVPLDVPVGFGSVRAEPKPVRPEPKPVRPEPKPVRAEPKPVRAEPVEALAQVQTYPTAQLLAHLYAPSRSAGFVAPGQTVLLRYASYPYQKFGMYEGLVSAVSKTPINPAELPQGSAQALMAAAQSNEPLYRITVNLHRQTVTAYGETQALKPGTALEADVLQDKRRIWEWVLEPVLAARQQAKAYL